MLSRCGCGRGFDSRRLHFTFRLDRADSAVSFGGNDFVLPLLFEPARVGVHRGLEVGLIAIASRGHDLWLVRARIRLSQWLLQRLAMRVAGASTSPIRSWARDRSISSGYPAGSRTSRQAGRFPSTR